MTIERFVPQLAPAPTCLLCGDKRMNGLNCAAASEAMWLYRASQGRIVTDACHVRDLTDDCEGGLRLSQMQTVSAMYGITTGKLYQPIDFDQVAAWVRTGRYGSHLNLSYAPFVGTPYDRFAGRFRGNHDVFLSGPGASGTLRVGDPGATAFHDIPTSLLKTAAGRLALSSFTDLNEEYGGGKCYAYVTPIDPATPATTYHVSITGPTPLYVSPSGVRAGGVNRASYTVRRKKSGGLWWYQILGTGTHANKWFKPSRYTRITLV